MIECKCKIHKQIFQKDDFCILSCKPMEEVAELQVNKYGTITVLGELSFLNLNKEYTLRLVEGDRYRGEQQYKVVSVKEFEIEDIESMTPEDNYRVLCEITTKNLANTIQKVYPDYCKRILLGQEVDTGKIKNVKDFRFSAHVRLLNEKFRYHKIMIDCEKYKIKLSEARDLYNYCCVVKGDNKPLDILEKTPYFALINICKRNFKSADSLILSVNPKMIDSDDRCLFYMLYILSQNEMKGNTYMNAVDMAEQLDSMVMPKAKKVAEESGLIYYDKKTNDIARMVTYYSELSIADFICKLLKHNTELDLDYQKFDNIQHGKIQMTDEQINVLKQFCKHNLLILDAKAGSGKTTVMKSLIDMCDAYKMDYALFAPTGKAAKRLSESTNRNATTIHRGTHMGTIGIDTDVVIVDEASMLNLSTASMLFNSILNKYSVRVLLVMDIEQLPPIGIGNIAREMINSNMIPMCTLTKVFRFASGGMTAVTTLSRSGTPYLDINDMRDNIILGKEKDYEYKKFTGDVNEIIDTYMSYINNGVNREDVVVLTPRNVGEYGTYNINNLIQEKINPVHKGEQIFSRKIKGENIEIRFHVGDLVMVTKNNYKMVSLRYHKIILNNRTITQDDVPHTSVFNGEMGVVVGMDNEGMHVSINDEIIVFYQNDINNLLLGYCTTIYKFQGSQIPYPIILTLNAHRSQLSKNLLYTSLSRGQKKVIEIANRDAIDYSLNHLVLDETKNKLCEYIKEVYADESRASVLTNRELGCGDSVHE